MTGNEFQNEVMRTASNGLSEKDAMVNASMGLSGEVGEYVDMLKKHLFHGHDLDALKCKKELGDIMFYAAWAAKIHGFDLEDVMQTVINKLRVRYPNGFNHQDSINRDVEAERAVLEKREYEKAKTSL